MSPGIRVNLVPICPLVAWVCLLVAWVCWYQHTRSLQWHAHATLVLSFCDLPCMIYMAWPCLVVAWVCWYQHTQVLLEHAPCSFMACIWHGHATIFLSFCGVLSLTQALTSPCHFQFLKTNKTI